MIGMQDFKGFVAATLLVFLAGCGSGEPVSIGFSGQLTGPRADLGVQGRDGATLAVEVLNEQGGVAGRKLRLLVRDDKGDMKGARQANRELVAEGVAAVIGHMTSSLTVAGLTVTQEAGIPMISPTASTTDLSGKKDLFFRVQPMISRAASALARHAAGTRGVESLAVIYDISNASYSDAYLRTFRESYAAHGGEVVAVASFDSEDTPNFQRPLLDLHTARPEGLLVIASALDSALVIQRYEALAPEDPVFSSGWALTPSLINNGGRAVEGLEMVVDYDERSTAPDYVDFVERFRERFGKSPTFAAAQAYEAVLLFAGGLLQAGGDPSQVAEALSQGMRIDGLQGSIYMDEFGDVSRDAFLIRVEDGQFVNVAHMTEPLQE